GSGRARRDPSRLLAAASLAALIGLYGGLWHPGLFWPTLFRGVVVVTVFTLGLTASRAVVDALVWHVRPWVAVTRVVVVAHTDDDWRDMALLIRRVRDLVVVGNVTLTRNGDGGRGVHPRLRQLRADIRACRAEMLILWGNLTDEEYGYALDVALSTGCRLVVGAPESLGGVKPHDVWIAGRQLVELTPPSLRGWQLALKRAMDLIGATTGLLLSAPLFAAITVAILLEDGPPVFFRQRRVGWGGRPFQMLKFRSMVTDAEGRLAALKARNIYADGRLFKLPDDPRVTRVGRFLRKNSLDELPQLLNVLAGSMSLVGPRPPIPSEVETYEERHYSRFHVKPGITGPWQAGGRNGITDFEEVVGLERRYIRSWSVMEDLRILLRTVPAVLRGSGAH
ncbi:MAG TPA: sugar transferase, partial [Gemmatimonadales bacterium]|nr:sugar transferase [Gemmatimonadales bacterium]